MSFVIIHYLISLAVGEMRIVNHQSSSLSFYRILYIFKDPINKIINEKLIIITISISKVGNFSYLENFKNNAAQYFLIILVKIFREKSIIFPIIPWE